MNVRVLALATWMACVSAGSGAALAQETVRIKGAPQAGVQERVAAVERLMESRNDESIRRFVKEQLSDKLRESKSDDEWLAFLKDLRRKYAGFATLRVAPAGESGVELQFGECPGADTPLIIELEPEPPRPFRAIRLGEPRKAASPRAGHEPRASLTWESVGARLKEEEAAGFSGSVLLVREGAIFLHEGYGFADREKKIPNGAETVFAVGSTPIDFTKGAILKLADMGKLSLTDPITRFLPDVPDDKKGITIEHLMTGRSGLRNFHGRPEDADPDNAWLDRETALKRMLADELLFAPGTDRAHSHSAFGMLAAIVEIASGESYAQFLDEHLFGPAGMKYTSHYEDIRVPDDALAVGYGGQPYSSPNTPRHWGKTSWLVLGSGGMVSTTGDLYRWTQAIRDGKLLSPQSASRYWSGPGSVLTGGSTNGFFTAYTEGPGSMMFLCSNEIGRERTKELVEDLVQLVNQPRFRLGVVLRTESDGLIIDEVQPGSPADRAGLRPGDRIVGVNGVALEGPSASEVLQAQLATGKPVDLRIQRGSSVINVTVAPQHPAGGP